MGGYDLRYQVQQFVAVLQSPTTGVRFWVLRTGDPKWYWFQVLVGGGPGVVFGDVGFPVRKADLLPRYRRALAHGWGNSL